MSFIVVIHLYHYHCLWCLVFLCTQIMILKKTFRGSTQHIGKECRDQQKVIKETISSVTSWTSTWKCDVFLVTKSFLTWQVLYSVCGMCQQLMFFEITKIDSYTSVEKFRFNESPQAKDSTKQKEHSEHDWNMTVLITI